MTALNFRQHKEGEEADLFTGQSGETDSGLGHDLFRDEAEDVYPGAVFNQAPEFSQSEMAGLGDNLTAKTTPGAVFEGGLQQKGYHLVPTDEEIGNVVAAIQESPEEIGNIGERRRRIFASLVADNDNNPSQISA